MVRRVRTDGSSRNSRGCALRKWRRELQRGADRSGRYQGVFRQEGEGKGKPERKAPEVFSCFVPSPTKSRRGCPPFSLREGPAVTGAVLPYSSRFRLAACHREPGDLHLGHSADL